MIRALFPQFGRSQPGRSPTYRRASSLRTPKTSTGAGLHSPLTGAGQRHLFDRATGRPGLLRRDRRAPEVGAEQTALTACASLNAFTVRGTARPARPSCQRARIRAPEKAERGFPRG